MDAVLKHVQRKVLSDPGVSDRLAQMAKNPAALDPEQLKMLQGGLALHNVHTGPGAREILIDGKIGPQTQEAAASFTAAPGLDESQIKLLQGGLRLLGYNGGPIDGVSGKGTEAALKKFATEHGIKNISVDEKGLEEIRKALINNVDARERIHAIAGAKDPSAYNVMALQAGLTLMGKTVVVDGSRGTGTMKAFDEWKAHAPPIESEKKQTSRKEFKKMAGEVTTPPMKKHFEETKPVITAPVPAPAAPAPAPKAATPQPSGIDARHPYGPDGVIDERKMSLEQRREYMMTTLPHAAAVKGVPDMLAKAVWGCETHFSRGRLIEGTGEYVLESGTGSSGSMQVTGETAEACVKTYGKAMAGDLRKMGLKNLADTVEKYQKRLKAGTATEADKQAIQDLRYDPRVNALMGTYLLEEKANSKYIKADMTNRQEWGKIYASYNIGQYATKCLGEKFADVEILPTGKELEDLMDKKKLSKKDIAEIREALGSDEEHWEQDWKDFKLVYSGARKNPHFFEDGATGAKAMENYQSYVEKMERAYKREFPAQTEFRQTADSVTRPQTAYAPLPAAPAPGMAAPAPG